VVLGDWSYSGFPGAQVVVSPVAWPINRRVKDRYGEPERGSEWEPIKILLEGDGALTRRTRLPTHVSDSLPKLAKPT
jgi:hypothetical protein